MSIRYTIKSDESGHDYYIRIGQEMYFEEWVEAAENGTEDEYDGPDFNANRIDGRFTFTDPRNE